MKTKGVLLLFNILYIIKEIQTSCVLESEFGLTINCNFKQTGLIRIRNLGGVKTYINLGFSLGDELGFPESLSNLEGNRRRSPKIDSIVTENLSDVNSRTTSKILQSRPKAIVSQQQMKQFDHTQNENKKIPTFKPLPENTQMSTKTLYDQYQVDLKGHTIEELAEFANVSVDVIKAAIKMRQDQMVEHENNKKTMKTTKTTITTLEPKVKKIKIYPSVSRKHKVMNAPKEYYPAGYDKNFDDDFKSKIELPATSFHCGDQKHFPGLYADDDLGCMVFHVCALTDDGLVMKSFLCPESTLFDQTILKCNWWFYTDCKSSKSLYDSNLPVSKSYQLMKSLDFFNSHYKNSLNLTRNNISEL